jgi:hypothetical protein
MRIDALDKESQNRLHGMQLPKLSDLEELPKKLMREHEIMLLTLIEEERLQSVRPGVRGMRLEELRGMRLKELRGMQLKELRGMRLRLRLQEMRQPQLLRLPGHTKPRRTQRRLMQRAEPRYTLTLRLRLRQGVQGVLLVQTQRRMRRRLLRMRRRLLEQQRK